jgi:hypothetical protein
MEHGMGEIGHREFTIDHGELIDQQCVAWAVADAGNSQQVGRRLRQEHRTKKGAVFDETQLSASPRTPDDMQHDFLLASALLNGGNLTELRQPVEWKRLSVLSIAMEKSGGQSRRSGD